MVVVYTNFFGGAFFSGGFFGPGVDSGGGDSTGYRRKRRVLRRIIKRRPEVKQQLEEFLKESAETLTHAGVLQGTAAEELANYHAVLAEILTGEAIQRADKTMAQWVRESVVDSILQAIMAEEEEEEQDEERAVLEFIQSLH